MFAIRSGLARERSLSGALHELAGAHPEALPREPQPHRREPPRGRQVLRRERRLPPALRLCPRRGDRPHGRRASPLGGCPRARALRADHARAGDRERLRDAHAQAHRGDHRGPFLGGADRGRRRVLPPGLGRRRDRATRGRAARGVPRHARCPDGASQPRDGHRPPRHRHPAGRGHRPRGGRRALRHRPLQGRQRIDGLRGGGRADRRGRQPHPGGRGAGRHARPRLGQRVPRHRGGPGASRGGEGHRRAPPRGRVPAALPHRRARAPRHGVRRRERRAGLCHRRGTAPAPRGLGVAPGQERGAGRSAALRPGDERARPRPALRRGEPAGGHRPRRAAPRLPAEVRPRDGPGDGPRGPLALAPRRARRSVALDLHPDRGGVPT